MTGILITDYWLIRKHKLIIPDLYRQEGIYWYNFGLNWKAFLVFFVVVAPSMRMLPLSPYFGILETDNAPF